MSEARKRLTGDFHVDELLDTEKGFVAGELCPKHAGSFCHEFIF